MSRNENGNPLDDFIVTAARQGLITIPWYCKPPFTDEKKAILRRFNEVRTRGVARGEPLAETAAALK